MIIRATIDLSAETITNRFFTRVRSGFRPPAKGLRIVIGPQGKVTAKSHVVATVLKVENGEVTTDISLLLKPGYVIIAD